MWQPQLAAFERRFRVLRYDSRGHGRSSVTPGPYTIELLSRDVLALLDMLGIARAHFCGLSMGGMVGLWLGVNERHRLGKLIVCNTAAKIGSPEAYDARIENVRKDGMDAVAATVLERWFTSQFRDRAPETLAHMRAMMVATPPDGYVACCAAVRDADQRYTISRIKVPTLVIGGAHDMATPPAAGRYVAEKIEDAQYVELEAAHISNIEAPDRFTAEVIDFLTGE
jgi:3-oxoadipate enol-lactonase